MSTKIYYGYRLPMMEHLDLIAFLQRVQKQIEEKAKELYNNEYYRIAIDLIDKAELGSYPNIKENSFVPCSYTRKLIDDKIKEVNISKIRNPSFDFSFDISVIPTSSCLLAIIYHEQEELRNVWESQEEVEEYGYWNNADPLENVPWEEWEKRGKDWDDALGDNHVGFSSYAYDCVIDWKIKYGKTIDDYKQCFKKRVNDNAESLLRSEFIDNHKNIEEAKKAIGTGDFMKIYWEFRDWFKTEDGLKSFEEKKLFVQSKLKKTITEEDLSKTIEIPDVEF